VNAFLELLGAQVATDLRGLPAQIRRGQTARRLERCRNIAELRDLARRLVPRAVFDFVDGAAGDEVTKRRNEEDFSRVVLAPRVLGDVSTIDLTTTVLGQPVALPLLAAPTGLTGLTHHRGELGIVRAAHAIGTVPVLSAMASYSIEEIARDAPGPAWFQLYMWRDRGLVRDLLERARAAGHLALVITADVPLAGARERDPRNGFGIPPRVTLRSLGQGIMRPRWSADFVRHPRMAVANAARQGGGPSDARSLTEYVNSQFDPTLTWADVAWVRELWGGPVIVKGILRADDARRAVEAGAAAVIVSNHGGRQLDHAPSSISALPAIANAVGGDAEVYLDGGIRRGADVVKALALGARACLAGRALVYGLGAGGDAGAARAFELLAREVRLAMALLGCSSVAQLDRSWLARQDERAPGGST
jgi:isopentenyl diphosphate isomerase/L-lactate dehydrogenase-like FMN-dependent dehydrogenase